MKKIIWIIVAIVVFALGYFLWPKRIEQTSTPPDQTTVDTAIFTSADQNISFTYPKTLSVIQKNNIITLSHTIKFANTDACDFKGTAKTSSTLTDFHTTIQLLNMTIASSAVTIDPTMATSTNINGDVLLVSPGFIDTYNAGQWNGYMVTEGVEGCGQITYYIPLSSSRTLVIQKQMIGALSDVADPTNKAKILATPGAISTELSNTIFSSLLQSLTVR
jgi:hypothetical protein